jgi:glutaredoxin
MALVSGFRETFGSITCRDLIGMDFSVPGEYQHFLESGIWKDKCMRYVTHMVEKIFDFEESRKTGGEQEKVTIYTKPGCRFCAEAIKDLKERGVPYEEISIEENPAAREEALRLSDGSGIVPVLVTEGGTVTVGFGGG